MLDLPALGAAWRTFTALEPATTVYPPRSTRSPRGQQRFR